MVLRPSHGAPPREAKRSGNAIREPKEVADSPARPGIGDDVSTERTFVTAGMVAVSAKKGSDTTSATRPTWSSVNMEMLADSTRSRVLIHYIRAFV